MKIVHLCAWLAMVLLARPALAQKPNPLEPIKDNAGLPRVLLIGDSISIGYTLEVRKLLENKANVHRIPTNGGPTSNGLKNIDLWLGQGKWDVIHFNWGLHDLKLDANGKHQVPLEQYEKNLRELVSRLKKTGAKLIWASTTPVPAGKVNPPRKPQDVEEYNKVAKKIMEDNGVAINDLYSAVLPTLKELQRPVNVHSTDQGSRFLAGIVTQQILRALPKKSPSKKASQQR